MKAHICSELRFVTFLPTLSCRSLTGAISLFCCLVTSFFSLLMNLSLSLSPLNVTVTVFYVPAVIPTTSPFIRGSLRYCLLYQRDLHLKKPTVPPRYSTPACSRTNRPWPTCSSSSRLPSYHQVRREGPSSSQGLCLCSGFVSERPSDSVMSLTRWNSLHGLARTCGRSMSVLPFRHYDIELRRYKYLGVCIVDINLNSSFIAMLQKDSRQHWKSPSSPFKTV